MGASMFSKKMTLDQFVNGLKAAWGDNLVSLLLYGSAATGEFAEGRSDYNTVAVLKDDRPAALAPARDLVRRWTRQGHPAPALFTTAKLTVSSDVFPMEYLDIRDHRKLLYGVDVFASLGIEPGNLRHQLENELWGGLQRLRRAWLAGDGRPATMERLRAESRPKFLLLFRHVLRLLGEPVPSHKAETVIPLCRRLGLDPDAFAPARPADAEEAFRKYLDALDRVAATVNAIS